MFRLSGLGIMAADSGDTIFGKIIRKEIPSDFLYEDDQVRHSKLFKNRFLCHFCLRFRNIYSQVSLFEIQKLCFLSAL